MTYHFTSCIACSTFLVKYRWQSIIISDEGRVWEPLLARVLLVWEIWVGRRRAHSNNRFRISIRMGSRHRVQHGRPRRNSEDKRCVCETHDYKCVRKLYDRRSGKRKEVFSFPSSHFQLTNTHIQKK